MQDADHAANGETLEQQYETVKKLTRYSEQSIARTATDLMAVWQERVQAAKAAHAGSRSSVVGASHTARIGRPRSVEEPPADEPSRGGPPRTAPVRSTLTWRLRC